MFTSKNQPNAPLTQTTHSVLIQEVELMSQNRSRGSTETGQSCEAH